MPPRSSLSRVAVLFLVLVVTEVVVILTVSILLLGDNKTSYSSLYYTSLVAITSLFLGYFGIDAVMEENPYQLLAFLLCSILLTIRVTYHFLLGHSKDFTLTTTSLYIALISTWIAQLLFFPIGYLVYKQFGWRMFHRAGASSAVIRLYRTYELFVSCLKLDIQFVCVITVMAGFFVNYDWAFGLIVLCAMLTVLLSMAVIQIGVKMELRCIVVVFLLFSLLAPIYVIYKVASIYHDESELKNVSGAERDDTRDNIAVSCFLFLVCRGIMLYTMIKTWRNFGMSLKENVFDREPANIFGRVYRTLVPDDIDELSPDDDSLLS